MQAGQSGAGLGHVALPLLFTNDGTATCTLSGYPGVAALDSSGAQVAQAQRTPQGYLGGLEGYSGGPLPVVSLAPGQTASAMVEGTDNPAGTATSCVTYAALLVTAPDTTTSVRVDSALPGCSALEVHPVVEGTSGRAVTAGG